MPIRVLIADDEETIREALADTLAAEADLEVVGAAKDADEAIALARQHKPDVALLDVRMPGGGGQKAAQGIARGSPKTMLVALSADEDAGAVLEMWQRGAGEYVGKTAPMQDVIDAIRRAAQKAAGPAQATT
jgi:DNA-binding NarL/FixJ family response regulator